MKLLRYAFSLLLYLVAAIGTLYLGQAQARPPQNERITVFDASIALVRALIEDYQRLHPAVEVRYSHLDTAQIYARGARAGAAQERPDLLLSSSTDLQVKLVNDGYALPHRSPQARALPASARWRDEVFAYGYEPVVMVYNRERLDPQRAPQTREQLQRLLRDKLGRLLNQLLSHASVTHRAELHHFKPLDLQTIARQALRESVPQAE
ncbi:MAG: ABC transporter substrate-binding protein, partial [Lysobacter sp.]|nr:ABC transporter substrate-binding protein [Lysobacter sp.]